jgi:hypothetical protein
VTHEQQCGPSSLIVIYRREGAASDQVVRWCGICGAVVVDEDYDGRTSPGSVMPMRFPLRRPLPVEQLVGEATPDHPAIYKPKEPAAQSSERGEG